jgi:hypothetical protein
VSKRWRINWIEALLLPIIVGIILLGVSVLVDYLRRPAGGDGNPKPPESPGRPWVATADVLERIAADLDKAKAADRPHLRYLTLAHRANDRHCSDADLDADRQAVRAMLAALAPAGRSVAVVADPGVVLRFDLRELDWIDDPDWRQVLVQYPYGLTYETAADGRLRAAGQKVQDLSGVKVAAVRGDWLAVALSRPPLGGPDGSLAKAAAVPDAVRRLAERYAQQHLDLDAAAVDLGLKGSEPLRSALAKEAYLREQFGLGALLEGKSVGREWWESGENVVTPYQELSRVLGLGKAFRLR